VALFDIAWVAVETAAGLGVAQTIAPLPSSAEWAVGAAPLPERSFSAAQTIASLPSLAEWAVGAVPLPERSFSVAQTIASFGGAAQMRAVAALPPGAFARAWVPWRARHPWP